MITGEPNDISSLNQFSELINKLEHDIGKYKATNINSSELRNQAKENVQYFFRNCSSPLINSQIDVKLLENLNNGCQSLLKLSFRPNSKVSFLQAIKYIKQLIEQITIALEIRHWDLSELTAKSEALSIEENNIYLTLLDIIPKVGLSFKQAIIDLNDSGRISYRGVANELRESLRETLDFFSPDIKVMNEPGFQLEKDRKQPTMKQKVRYILRARGMAKNAMKTPEDATETIEARIADFTRATYDRSSIASHTSAERSEVIQIKKYVMVVLSEILSLPN
jgi:hypothetical protein